MALLPIRRQQAQPQLGFGSLLPMFNQLQQEMNRLLSSFPTFTFPSFFEEELTAGAWAPQVDVYEDDQNIRVKADLPGLEPKDIDVRVDNGVLTIQGERKWSEEKKKENYHRVERAYGSFTRSFMLPDYADTDKVEAKFKNGVLEVCIPKKPEAVKQSKKIPIAA